jgi:CRISPR/Cas system-associated exonuclease Cas4 (RecB family)
MPEPIIHLEFVKSLERPIGPHRLGQYISRNRCERYLRLALFPSDAKPYIDRYNVGYDSLSPLLSKEGQVFEKEKIEALRASGERVVDLQNQSTGDLISELKAQPIGRTYYYQPTLESTIGGWPCSGIADLIQVVKDSDGKIDILIIDIKASHHETIGFRLQVAFYARLLQEKAKNEDLVITNLSGAIASRDVEFDPGKFRIFDLSIYTDEIDRLIAEPDSDVERAVKTSFKEAFYHLGPHCDGCSYNSLCFIDTAERQDLSLIPLNTATEKRALQIENIDKVSNLASLMCYGEKGMETSPGCEEQLERISKQWPLGSHLPILIQRARAALKRNDKSIEAKRFIYGSDKSSLPDESAYPGLVKVFIDTARDYLQDRLFMLSALVVGPSSTSIEVVEITSAPPDTDSERELIVNWIQSVLPAVKKVADSDTAPLHIYLFDRKGQRSLLDALARHFETLCSIPAFYDLLTSTPALTQSMISFLGDEVKERQNLSIICYNLYDVARAMNFNWSDSTVDIPKAFRSRIFDNYRAYELDPIKNQFKIPEDSSSNTASKKIWVESAARFGTEVPIEYAYAAWGILKETLGMSKESLSQLRVFLKTNLDDLRKLSSQRLKALQYIENTCRNKSKQVEKQELELSRLHEVEIFPEEVPFNRSLEYFLYLEHHAKMQELLLHFSLPPALRAETNRTAIIKCDSYEKAEKAKKREAQASFTITNIDGTALSVKDASMASIREGDWVVLNHLVEGEKRETPLGKKLVYGRLCVVEKVDAGNIKLSLKSMNLKNSEFRFGHRMIEPEVGSLYTIDEMADDFNADKYLLACRNAESNRLYQWISNPEAGKTPRLIRPSRLRTAERIAALAEEAQAPHGLTSAQKSVIGNYITERALVLQGPPGTGKSHTLGFAVLSRMLSLLTQVQPFRVLVAAKTHAATNIALESIGKRTAVLLSRFPSDALISQLSDMKIYKVCNDLSDPVPHGVDTLSADGDEELKGWQQWDNLMEKRLLVIGGTPGGIYNLIKRGPAKNKNIDWSHKYFDLVIVDEASQMGIAEAITAGAFLRDEGQFIAIGDHRQMSPILAHAWDQESRRDLKHAKPHLSIFELLKELGFTSTALDESFRLPSEIAEFLREYIYVEDGINYRSNNKERLKRAEDVDGWIKATLEPDYPLVVIEHNETGSQQQNEYEAAIIEEITSVAISRLGLDVKDGIGIVVPHRAQKHLLQERLPELADSIDTVERFQGGERELIIVSATVSDREYAQMESSFLLEPRRSTVAISRPKKKLIVICSRTIFDLIPTDLDAYEHGALWKYLRHRCKDILWEGNVNECKLRVSRL